MCEYSTEGLVADAVPMWRVGRALCGGRASVGTRLRLARFLACQWVGSWMIMGGAEKHILTCTVLSLQLCMI